MYQEAVRLIENANFILVGAGAGMSVDSGLPDFRGKEGFWNAYPPARLANKTFAEIANPSEFKFDPKSAWGFYGYRYNLYKQATPHVGYAQLLEILSILKKPYFVYTSNVDGHFQKAGFPEGKIAECHGNINWLQCIDNCSCELWKSRKPKYRLDTHNLKFTDNLPKCPICGSIARPNIAMFQDWEWESTRSDRQINRLYEALKNYGKSNILALEIGAGTAIPTVREFCADEAGKVIRFNPEAEKNDARTVIHFQETAQSALNSIYSSC